MAPDDRSADPPWVVDMDGPLPPDRAFVIQLRAPGTPGGDLFIGRAEHIASGVAARFGSAAELLGFVRKLLSPQPPMPESSAAPHDCKGRDR